ncbi:class I adenylate-forming enzyme family protein [Streptomyces sp. 8N616]|uniref:class I adenylate-forming enzyme family protein n=1 Tax=Streptomyces sp. 8N616 TaxID=3457414 RepID=UPI003FD337CE
MENLLHRWLDERAEKTPDSPAITSAGRQLTYGQLRAESVRLASWMWRTGVPRGGIVVIAVPTSVVVPELMYAASRIGAVYCVLHEKTTGAAMEHVLDDTSPALVVADDPDMQKVAIRRGVRVVDSGAIASASDSEPPAGTVPESLSPDRPLCLIYTSGSTSRPKAVVTTHQQAAFVSRAIHSRLKYRRDDVVYTPLPLSFDYGKYQLFLGLLSGAHIRLGSTAEAGPPLLRNLVRSQATVLPALPAIAETLAWLLARHQGEPPPLRLLTNTGAAMPPKTLAQLRAALPHMSVQLMYGLTECKRVAINPPDEDLRRPGASGRPLPGTHVHVADENGNPLPPGEVGEFIVRGPHVMDGYWKCPEQTAQRFLRDDGQQPALRTGDYGWMDPEGYLYVQGRRDDIYKERGFRVSTTEVEAAAQAIRGVRLAAVLPPGHHPESARPSSVLVVTGDLTAEQTLAALRLQIEPYKIPRRCLALDSLPLSGNGKVDKKALATYVEGYGRRS